jgi:hypothetical protein
MSRTLDFSQAATPGFRRRLNRRRRPTSSAGERLLNRVAPAIA